MGPGRKWGCVRGGRCCVTLVLCLCAVRIGVGHAYRFWYALSGAGGRHRLNNHLLYRGMLIYSLYIVSCDFDLDSKPRPQSPSNEPASLTHAQPRRQLPLPQRPFPRLPPHNTAISTLTPSPTNSARERHTSTPAPSHKSAREPAHKRQTHTLPVLYNRHRRHSPSRRDLSLPPRTVDYHLTTTPSTPRPRSYEQRSAAAADGTRPRTRAPST